MWSNNTMVQTKNMRDHFRVHVGLNATLQLSGEKHNAKIVDISSGGMRIECTKSLPIDEHMTVRVMVHNNRVAVRCKVTREVMSDAAVYHYGVKYIFVNASDLKIINSFVLEMQALTRWQ